MAATKTFPLLTVAVLTFMMTSLPCGEARKQDIKVKYYASTILHCQENVTTVPNAKVFWITPDNFVIEGPTSAMPKHVGLVNGTVISMLNVTHIGDDESGYYTCVMVDRASLQAEVMRWGLNVDGADFSELEKEYRENAIVGAIAASVMLVLVGGACLIWHYRYHKRAGRKGDGPAADTSDDDDLKKPSSAESHVNKGYDNGDASPAAVATTTTTTTAAVDIEMVEQASAMSNESSVTHDVQM